MVLVFSVGFLEKKKTKSSHYLELVRRTNVFGLFGKLLKDSSYSNISFTKMVLQLTEPEAHILQSA